MTVPTNRNPLTRLRELRDRLRGKAGALLADGFFSGAARLGKLHPQAAPERHNVEVERDVPYLSSGRIEHRLDVYKPIGTPGPWPIVLYVHGGGFRILSKDTHWVMGLVFARAGYLVYNISYRLAPKHPYPAALEDAGAALAFVKGDAQRRGGDLSRLVLAGESAGANLVTALAIACAYQRPEPWARAIHDLGVVPRAVAACCGILQVTDTARIRRRKPKLAQFVADRLAEVTECYLGDPRAQPAEAHALADPLLILERGERPARPLPAFFAPVGTRDPLLDDTRRLRRALDALGVACDDRYYPGEAHAFHAFVFRKQARECWEHLFGFLRRHL